jgi:hypothetical protein
MIDWTKPIETVEDGHPARVMGLLSLAMESSPIEPDESGFEPMMVWVYRDGKRGWGDVFLVNNEGFRVDDRALFSARQEPFIRNVKVKKEGWVNLYRDKKGKVFAGGTIHASKEEAIRCNCPYEKHIGADFVEWEE